MDVHPLVIKNSDNKSFSQPHNLYRTFSVQVKTIVPRMIRLSPQTVAFEKLPPT